MYLSLVEDGNDLYVYCDGYYLKFHTSTTDFLGYCQIYSNDDVYRTAIHSAFSDSDFQGSSIVKTILENTPTRVVIRLYLDETLADGTPITEVDSRTIYATIYSDRIFIKANLIVNSAYTIPGQTLYYGIISIGQRENTTNLFAKESSGSEVLLTDSSSNTVDFDTYFAQLGYDDLVSYRVAQFIPIYHDVGNGYYSQNYRYNTPKMQWVDGADIEPGTYTMAACIIFDSQDRETLHAVDDVTWTSGETYAIGDVATYSSNNYENITGTNTATVPPSDATNWCLFICIPSQTV